MGQCSHYRHRVRNLKQLGLELELEREVKLGPASNLTEFLPCQISDLAAMHFHDFCQDFVVEGSLLNCC